MVGAAFFFSLMSVLVKAVGRTVMTAIVNGNGGKLLRLWFRYSKSCSLTTITSVTAVGEFPGS